MNSRASYMYGMMLDINENGFMNFYNAWPASVILSMNPALTYVFFDYIKAYMLKGSKEKIKHTRPGKNLKVEEWE